MPQRTIIVFAVFYCTFCTALASTDDKQQVAESLIRASQAVVNIRSVGTSPFLMRSKVRFLNPIQQLEVNYTEIWNSPDHWRREINFPDFQQIEVGGKERRWMMKDLESEPPQMQRVRELFAVGVGLTTGKVKKVVEQEVSGVQVKCVESRRGEIEQSLCFDAVTGALLLRRERSGSYESYYEYADYQKVGEKRYPRSLRYYQNGHKEIEAEVSELSTELSADPGIFELPGAKEWPACDKVEPPKGLSMPDPSFPSGVKTNNAMSVLILLVTKDGRPERLRVEHSGGAAFDDAAMQAVRRWTFQPALCNGTMIPVQITVEVDFRR